MVKLGSWDLLHQGIDLHNGGILLSSEGQVHHGDIRGGHALETGWGSMKPWGVGKGMAVASRTGGFTPFL